MNNSSTSVERWPDREEREYQERPFGVTLAVVAIVLGALLNLFLAFNSYILSQKQDSDPVAALLFLAEAIIGIVVAFGLWKLAEWARKGAVALFGLMLVVNFITNFNEPLTGASLAGLVLPAAIVIYLLQPQVADRFI